MTLLAAADKLPYAWLSTVRSLVVFVGWWLSLGILSSVGLGTGPRPLPLARCAG
jgi:hypothetical protein